MAIQVPQEKTSPRRLTTNYQLGKWNDLDNPGADGLNQNWDKIDTLIKNVSGSIPSLVGLAEVNAENNFSQMNVFNGGVSSHTDIMVVDDSGVDPKGITFIKGDEYGSFLKPEQSTESRTWTLPNKSGTIALTTDTVMFDSGSLAKLNEPNTFTESVAVEGGLTVGSSHPTGASGHIELRNVRTMFYTTTSIYPSNVQFPEDVNLILPNISGEIALKSEVPEIDDTMALPNKTFSSEKITQELRGLINDNAWDDTQNTFSSNKITSLLNEKVDKTEFDYGHLAGKPTTFTPSTHTHNIDTIYNGEVEYDYWLSHYGTAQYANGCQGNFTVAGDITWNASDERLKNIKGIIQNPIEKVNQLNGVEFTWNEKYNNGSATGKTAYGLIAQEVQKVLPEAVTVREDGYLTYNFVQVIPLLVEAIKAQQTQINELAERMNKLENK